jgi:TonB family protein
MWMRIALLCGLTSLGWAGSPLEKVKDDLKAAPQVLRGFPEGDKLTYDSQGERANRHSGSWTVDGLVSVEDLEINGNELRIRAHRMIAIFDAKTQKPEFRSYKGKVELRLPYIDDAQAEQALRRVFILRPETLRENLPAVWRQFFERQTEAAPAPLPENPRKRNCKAPEKGVYTTCEGITAPRPDGYRREPEFGEIARRFKIQGAMTVVGIVDVNGRMRDLEIYKALGAGLDEQGLDAVSQWRFKPARKDGIAVPVKIMIDVDFHLY